MDDLIKSFKAQLYDRVTSPLLSSFLIAWTAWNHRLLAVFLTSDMKIKEKFAYVDEVLYPGIHEIGLRGFLWPLLSALALLFLYPVPGRWVYQYVRTEHKRLKEIQQRIDDETPMTMADARELRVAIRKAEQEFDAQNKVIAGLRETIANQDTQLKYALAGGGATPAINVRQRKMLAIIATRNDFPTDFFQQSASADPVLIGHEVDKLVEYGFVSEKNISGARRLDITPKGRQYLVENEPSLANKFKDPSMAQFDLD
jgi:hypothetical protein